MGMEGEEKEAVKGGNGGINLSNLCISFVPLIMTLS